MNLDSFFLLEDAHFWGTLAKIMGINIILSGDNAVVIAMAARGLPIRQQKAAIFWGSGGAVVLRILLAAIAIKLLAIPYLQLVGGLMLIWIAYKLLVENDEQEEGSGKQENGHLMNAIKTILIADVVMSLDNTIAIAGAADNNMLLLGLGLALSIPLVIFGSALIMKIMERFPIVVYIGAGLIAWTAGEMIQKDKAVSPFLTNHWDKPFHAWPLHHYYLPAAITILVIGLGFWHSRRAERLTSEEVVSEESATEG